MGDDQLQLYCQMIDEKSQVADHSVALLLFVSGADANDTAGA